MFFQYQILLHILIKQPLSFLALKFETYNSFLLGEMVAFIPPSRCAQKVGFPRSSHIFELNEWAAKILTVLLLQ